MAANIPDMNAIHNLGKQFDTPKNVFDIAQKHFDKKNKKAVQAQVKQAKQTESNRNKFANSATQAVKQGRQQFAKNVQAQQKQANQAAKAYAAGVKSGRVAPAQGAEPRTFAMPSSPDAKTMQQQRNYAHGEALGMQRQMNRAEATAQTLQQRHAATVSTHQQKAAINLNLAQEKHRASTEAHAAKAATSINALAQKQQMQQSHQSSMAAGKQKAFDVSGAQKLELQSYVNKQKLQHQANMHAQRQSQKPVKKATAAPTGMATSVSQAATPSFSSPSPTHTPVKAIAIPQTSFSSQLAPQKPLAKPQGAATASFSSGGGQSTAKPSATPTGSPVSSQFSHATPVKPKSLIPTFSNKTTSPPRNVTPSFSDNKPSKPKPLGSTTTSFSHGG